MDKGEVDAAPIGRPAAPKQDPDTPGPGNEAAQLEDIKPELEDAAQKEGGKRKKKWKLTQEEIEAGEDAISRKFHGVFRYHGKVSFLAKNSLYCFDRDTKIRHAFVWFVEWPWFDRFITIVILLNSLLLAFTDYQERVNPLHESELNAVFAKIDIVFSIIFLIECMSKNIAFGFVFHKRAYLKDYWNWLDFFIVIVSVIGWLPGVNAGALKALRTFRILRPLRSINALPEMRGLIQTLLASIPGLMNVVFFLMFIFGIFAIFGVNQFNGDLYNRCRTTEEPTYVDGVITEWGSVDDFEGWLCKFDDPESCRSQVEIEEGVTPVLKCGNLGKEYATSPRTLDSVIDQESIQYGIVGFDEIGQGMSTIFQVLTLEGWSDLTYNYSDANDPTIAVAFFIGIVVMGAFFAMNLVLGQVMESFYETQDAQQEKDREDKIAAEEAAEAKRLEEEEEAEELAREEEEERMEKLAEQQAAIENGAIITENGGVGVPDTYHDAPQTERKMLEDEKLAKLDQPPPEDSEKEDRDRNDIFHDSNAEFYFGDSEEDYERLSRIRAKGKCCVNFFYRLVTSVGFNFFIFLLIIANTLTLSLYRFDQSDMKTEILAWCNEFFTWAFTLEMVFKIIGLGCPMYAKDVWNKFDAVVVTISLIDWVITRSVPEDKIGSLGEAMNAFRAMRLLRVLKLARLWGALAKILSQTMASLKDLTYYAALLFLFMFIFALLGMELFAERQKYDDNGDLLKGDIAIQEQFAANGILESPRENFDTVWEALTTIFIVIVGEDWNWVMYGFVRAKGYESRVWYYLTMGYFMLLMILGNIMLFSLFTAILLKNFEGDMSDQIQASKEASLSQSNQMKKSVTQRLFDKDTWSNFAAGFNDAFTARHNRVEWPKLSDKTKVGGQTWAELKEEGAMKDDFDLEEFTHNQRKTLKKLIAAQAAQGDMEELKINNVAEEFGLDPDEVSDMSDDGPFDKAEGGDEKPKNRKSAPEKLEHDEEDSDDLNIQQEKENAKYNRRSVLSMRKQRSILMHYDEDGGGNTAEEKGAEIRQMHGTSLCLFSKTNCFRKMCWIVCTNKWFDNTILFLIVVSTLTLAVETPFDDPNGQKIEILTYIDYFMTGAFTLECITKIIAFGFIQVQTAYIRDPWNILDFIIVISAVAGFLMPPGVNISAVKSLRILRILRPLKIISKNKSLKIALTSLVNSIPKIANLQVIVFFFMFLLSILQTTLLSGKFYRCEAEHLGDYLSYRQQGAQIIDKWDCINLGGEWINPYLHFDDTLWSLLTLFTIQTTEGWIGVMWDSTNAKGVDLQPQGNVAPYMVVVFIILVIIISMLFLNLFVGVVIETFNVEKELLSYNQLLKPSQKAWIQIQIMSYSMKPQLKNVHTGNKFRDFCIDIVNHKAFDGFIMGCIIGNTIVLAIKWYIMPPMVVDVIEVVNYVFMVIFTLEAVLKITAMRGNYFKDSWNIFDFTVVVLTAVILGITWLGVGGNLGVTSTILRSLRIGRIFRLVKRAKKLQIIFQALIDAVPSMGSLGLLLFLLIFMYSIIGISQFAMIKIDGGLEDIEGYNLGQDAMNKHANFQSFGNAFLTLFRCATGEAWNSIMFDSARYKTILFQCREKEDYFTWQAAGGGIYDAFACGSPGIAYGYHMSFQIIVSQVFLNIFIAIIIDSFAGQSAAFDLPVLEADIEAFVEIWSRYDPHATGFIPANEFEQLLIELAEDESAQNLLLSPELIIPEFEVAEGTSGDKDFDKNCARRRRYMAMLDIPIYNNWQNVMFYDVLQQLTIHIVMYVFNKKTIEKNKKKMAVISAFAGTANNDTLGAIACTQFQSSYDVDFHNFTTGSARMDIKVDLMNTLKKKVKEMKAKSYLGQVDQISKTVAGAEGIYTTRHYIFGSYIKEALLEIHTFSKTGKRSKKKVLKAGSFRSPSFLAPIPDDGLLARIPEEEADKEHTYKASSRKSQNDEEDAAGINYAINEPEALDAEEEDEDESMQRDTAFMNDKKHLK